MIRSTRPELVVPLASLLALASLVAGDALAAPCEPGSSEVLAAMPVDQPFFPPTGPTYPEGVAVVGTRVVTSGPATFGTAGNGSPSQLTVFDARTGVLRAEIPLVGEDLSQEHALSELASQGSTVYAPSTQLGVLSWKFTGNQDAPAQQAVSTPFCSVSIPFPCLTTTDACPPDMRFGLPPLPNGIAIAGSDIFVTDSLQGIIWTMRKPSPHAEALADPEVLFCSGALQGSGNEGLSLFGANGIAVVSDWIYVAVTFGPLGPTGPTSVIYRLPRINPSASDLAIAYTYVPVEVAPGIFVPPIADGLRHDAASNDLLVVLGGQNQVSRLDLDTDPPTEIARYSRTDADHPLLNPSTIALGDDGVAYVTNHAITCCLPGDPNPACGGCNNAQDYFGVIRLCVE